MRDELEYCASHGIPRSRFLGYTSGDGPEWTDEDRAYALAWQEYKRTLCSGCGHDLHETTKAEHQYAYGGEVIRCHACAAQSRTVEKFVDDGGEKAGIMFRMTDTPNMK